MANTQYLGRVVFNQIKEGGSYKKIAASLNATLTITPKLIDITTKDSGSADEKLPDRYSWQITGSGNAIDDTAVGTVGISVKTLSDAAIGLTLIDTEFTSVDTKIYYQGNAYLSNFKITADDGKVVTFDYTLDGTGPLVDVAP